VPRLQVSFDLDPAGIEADESVGDGACQHVVTVDDKTSHDCAKCVTIAAPLERA